MEPDKDFLFIEEIKSHPALYNSNHVNYANMNVRNELWEEITEKFKLTINAKHKWKDIRDRYVREKKKEKNRTKPRLTTYPPWKCLPKLRWLDDHLRTYTFVTRQPTSKKTKTNKKKNNQNTKTTTNPNKSKETIEIEYEICKNDDIKEEDINDIKVEENTFKTKEIEFYEDCKTDEIDPFKITAEHKCGQIYMDNEKLIFLCDFCENLFYESNTFCAHILHVHPSDCIRKTNNDSLLNLEYENEVEFLEFNDSNDVPSVNTSEYDDYSFQNIKKTDSSNDETQTSQDLNSNIDDSTNSNFLNKTENDLQKNEDNSDSDNEPEMNIFNLQRPKKIPNENNEYPCPMCDKTYRLYHSLTYHFRNLHANINKCDHCDEIFQSATSLKTHLRKIHRVFRRKIGQEELLNNVKKQLNKNEIPLVPPQIRNNDDRFVCLICNNNYSRHETLRKHHINVHLNGKNIVNRCELCDKTFQTEYLLKIHKATHNDNRKYKCTKCDADFVHPKFLGIHLRSHLGNRKYPCEYCSETFPKRIDKIAHERTKHTKEKPYQCENCLESFTKYSELIVHKNRKHNPNQVKRTYVCSYCNKVFHRNDSYSYHVRKHEGKRPFQCTVCMARFVCSSTLRSHKKIHKKN